MSLREAAEHTVTVAHLTLYSLMTSCCVREASVLQLVLVQVVDVQLLASGRQDLLLLLPLGLFLASSLLVSLDSNGKHFTPTHRPKSTNIRG